MKSFIANDIKQFLDAHVIGQDHIKQTLSVLLANKYTNPELYKTTHYATMLLIGPAGIGKTTIIKSVAKFLHAPLVRLSALSIINTNYQEIFKQLMTNLIELVIAHREAYWREKYAANAIQLAQDKVIEIIAKILGEDIYKVRKGLNKQRYNHMIIPIGSYYKDKVGNNIHLPVSEAIKFIQENELEKVLSMHDFSHEVIQEVENTGIIAIDDIDKLASNPFSSHNIREMKQLEICQRVFTELLTGMSITTKYGQINTRGILFICMGHFNDTQVSHLLPELQAKLLNMSFCQSLTRDDMMLILTSIEGNLLQQYIGMLKKINIDVKMDFKAISAICECAYKLNQTETNLGIIRLYALIDKLFEPFFCYRIDIAQSQPYKTKTMEITSEYIHQLFAEQEELCDYSRYIL